MPNQETSSAYDWTDEMKEYQQVTRKMSYLNKLELEPHYLELRVFNSCNFPWTFWFVLCLFDSSFGKMWAAITLTLLTIVKKKLIIFGPDLILQLCGEEEIDMQIYLCSHMFKKP